MIITAANIDFSAVTSETRRITNGVEWCLRYDGAIVAEGACIGAPAVVLRDAFRAIVAARADRDAIVDRYRFALYCRGRVA